MKKISDLRGLALIVLAMAVTAVFPGVAAANLFIEEGTETIPAKTVDTGEPVVTADKFPVDVTGERLEIPGLEKGKLEVLDMGESSVSCDVVAIDGGTLSEPAPGLELSAEYSECVLKVSGEEYGELPVSMNSCEYVLSDIEPLASGSNIAAEIACDEGDAIEIDYFSSGCVISIPPQSLGTETEYANIAPEGEKQLAVGIIDSNVTYNSNSFICFLGGLPDEGTYEDGTLHSDVGLSELFIEEGTETIPAKTVDTGEPVVTADKFPVDVTGERLEIPGLEKGKLEVLDMGESSVSCDVVAIDGGTLSEPAPGLELSAEYSECVLKLSGKEYGSILVSMNSCEYVLSDIEPLASGSNIAAEITCDEGDAIEIDHLSTGCAISIPPQSLGTETEYANIAPEGEKQLAVGIIDSTVTYNIDNIICSLGGLPDEGTYEDGTLHSDVGLQGA